MFAAPSNLLFWVLFLAFVGVMLVLDLGVFNRNAHVVRFREAIAWTAAWVALAGVFAVLLWFFGHRMAADIGHSNRQLTMEFIAGYLVEESLSVDNLFVFLLVFRFYKVPAELQHKVLFWGIMGAIIMRAVFIFAGVSLLNRFHWIEYIFGVFLVYVGFKLLFQKEGDMHPEDSFITRIAQKHLRLTPNYVGGKFTLVMDGVRYFTPLALVLIIVETTDVLFAVDSIPAVLAVTRNPFIVFTSNIFAILGLRSLYFALSGLMDLFHFLHYGLAIILMFIGTKMLAGNFVEIGVGWALLVIIVLLAGSVALSLIFPKKENEKVAEAEG